MFSSAVYYYYFTPPPPPPPPMMMMYPPPPVAAIPIVPTFYSADESVVRSERKKDLQQQSQQQGKGRKKGEGRWGGRQEKRDFAHPWLLTTLKGHTGQVLDMEFSSNGKYLASCAEEDPDPGGEELVGDAGSEKENSTPSSADPSPRTKGLSRRQRKNRRREDASPPETKKKPKPKRQEGACPTTGGSAACRKPPVQCPLGQYQRLNIGEKNLSMLLRSYVLTNEQLMDFGYPFESPIYPGKAAIIRNGACASNIRCKPDISDSRFDVNAREFVPGLYLKGAYDGSGQASGSSSDSGENIEDSEDSVTGSDCGEDSSKVCYSESLDEDEVGVGVERKCSRCGRGFFIANDRYLSQEKCSYHWGKLHQILGDNATKHQRLYGLNVEYSCCRGKEGSRGCSTGRLHVWSGVENGYNGPLDSYVRTKPRKTQPVDGNYGVYALDCEMCFTVNGLELTKITVVGADGRLVYDSFVRPDSDIVDYNTRFSGITAKDLGKKNCVKTLREVQNDLMGFINADTILVGHGLENDLRALRIIHFTCVDTAFTFPHFNGWPFRRSLKALTTSFLKRDIQGGSGGHNSYEDATAAMELMLWRVRKDFKAIIDDNFIYYM